MTFGTFLPMQLFRMAMKTNLSEITEVRAEYWEQRHAKADTPWCLKMPSPPLTEYFRQVEDKNRSILIPGAGHHYEAQWLLEEGFTDITVCDISATAIQNIRKLTGFSSRIRYIQDDFFQITGSYDFIAEQTFFCALHPSLREAYARKIAQLLNVEGRWVAVLFARHFEQNGPPYGGDEYEYKTLFSKYIEIKDISMCHNSAKPRQDSELFVIGKKRIC
jgi:hypothetical protein